jgi:hypothetical protein
MHYEQIKYLNLVANESVDLDGIRADMLWGTKSLKINSLIPYLNTWNLNVVQNILFEFGFYVEIKF